MVLADRHTLVNALINLIFNANKSSDNGTTITAFTRHQGDDVAFQVADGEVGIPADRLASLLTGMFPAAVGQTRERNLKAVALVRFPVERCQDQLTAQSQVSEGSRFTSTHDPWTRADKGFLRRP